MSRIQQVLFQLDAEYYGHPYYVTGNALYNAIAQRVESATRRALCVSHGVFLPGEYGSYPAWHSQSGSLGKIGSELPPVESYEDLFLLRDAAHRWLKSSRPRDVHNAHPMQTHGGRVTFAPVTWFGRPPEFATSKRGVRWYVHCYLHAGSAVDDEILPVPAEVLDGLQVGGGRNYGFGALSHVDSQLIDTDELSFDRLAAADEHVIELISPFVTASSYPGADDQSVPWWWDVARSDGRNGRVSDSTTEPTRDASDGLRRRAERLAADGSVYEIETIDHGQRVGYAGDAPIETAKNGVLRIGTHARYGFGELWVRPASDDRVSDRGDH
ncbi:hypothetical protein [Halalkalirubrum salinum]|uniref:hypothetical protein n=1 Tax=Halalkalirubrum salinum TaxID=2563889 RepID=UPI0010FB0DF2|nr:hypothetical protein [Halalkalirubrum salinum]